MLLPTVLVHFDRQTFCRRHATRLDWPHGATIQFGFRALGGATALLAVGLAVVTNRVREQRQVSAQLKALGWTMRLFWEGKTEEPNGPAWLRRLIGDDYFQKVDVVSFGINLELEETRTASLFRSGVVIPFEPAPTRNPK
jgi:hypothetical protein